MDETTLPLAMGCYRLPNGLRVVLQDHFWLCKIITAFLKKQLCVGGLCVIQTRSQACDDGTVAHVACVTQICCMFMARSKVGYQGQASAGQWPHYAQAASEAEE